MVESTHIDTIPWTLQRGWLPNNDSKRWAKEINQKINWLQPVVQVFGKKYPVPRMTVFLAEEGLSYYYSGTLHKGFGWPIWFIPLLKRVNSACKTPFNGCLLNHYRNGEDRMGWHSDDEPEVDQDQPIASLSLGESRDFQFRHRFDKTRKTSLSLDNGDLLIMHPGCQEHWMHSVPKRKRIIASRINLTFRYFVDKEIIRKARANSQFN